MSRRNKKKKRKSPMHTDYYHNSFRAPVTPFNPPTVPSSSGPVRIRVELHGEVQGVSCRYRVTEIVELLSRFSSITGFVLNSPSSKELVVIQAQGSPDALNRFLLLVAYELRSSLTSPLVFTSLPLRPERGFYARGLLNYDHLPPAQNPNPQNPPRNLTDRSPSRERLEKHFHNFR